MGMLYSSESVLVPLRFVIIWGMHQRQAVIFLFLQNLRIPLCDTNGRPETNFFHPSFSGFFQEVFFQRLF